MENLWIIYGKSIEHLSKIYRKPIENLSKIYGKSIENLLKIYRESIENLSKIYGMVGYFWPLWGYFGVTLGSSLVHQGDFGALCEPFRRRKT